MSKSIHYSAASLDALAAQLSSRIVASKSLFQAIYILNTRPSSNKWWMQQIVKNNGIAAHLHFLNISKAIDSIGQAITHKIRAKQMPAKHLLCWQIFEALQQHNFQQKFPAIAAYYFEDEAKQFVLSSKIAELFHQYEQDLIDLKSTDSDFQNYLWNYILHKNNPLYVKEVSFLAQIEQQLQRKDKRLNIQKQFAELHVLHPEQLSPFQVQFFQLLSQYLPICFYSHTFLASKTPSNLAQSWATNPPSLAGLDHCQAIQLARKTLSPSTILARVQANLYQGKDDRINPANKDHSIQIDCGHTIGRSVEILYDFLMNILVQASSPYAAQDIVVHVVDIEAYAAAIHRVFGSAPVNLPYSIQHTSTTSKDSCWNALLALLDVSIELKASEVIELLEFSSLQASFEFEDLNLIKILLEEANIRQGIRGQKELQTDLVSWTKGLQRLIYGYCFGGQDFYSIQNGTSLHEGWAVDKVEGSSLEDLMRLKALIDALTDWLDQQQCRRNLDDWISIFLQTTTLFLIPEEQVQIRNFSQKISACQDQLLVASPIQYQVFKSFVQQLIAEETPRSNLPKKGINFSPLELQMTVPKKIICFLGVDLHRFPREERLFQYDLRHRLPDRLNLIQKDYYFLLQNLCLAQDFFYLGYQGYDEQHRPFPPCSVIETLQDYVQQISNNTFANIQKYPASLSDKRYNRIEKPNFKSYLKPPSSLRQQYLLGSPVKNNKASEVQEISLENWLRFFSHPVKHFLHQQARYSYSKTEMHVQDTELFELGPLGRWFIKEALMQPTEDQKQLKEWKEKGFLPLSMLGTVTHDNLEEFVQPFRAAFEQLKQGNTAQFIDINVSIDSVILRGKLGPICGQRLLHYTFSSTIKERLQCALKYLLISASDLPYTAYFVHPNIEQLPILSPSAARDKLRQLVDIFLKGQHEPFLFSADLKAKQCAKILKKTATLDDLLKYQAPYFEALDWTFFDQERSLKTFEANVQYLLVDLLELPL